MLISLSCCNRFGVYSNKLVAIAVEEPFELELVGNAPFKVMLDTNEVLLGGHRTRAIPTGPDGNIYWQAFEFSNLDAAHFLAYAMGIGFKTLLVSEPLPLNTADRPFTVDEFIDAIDPSLKLEKEEKS